MTLFVDFISDADDFEPQGPAGPAATTDKWEGEDSEEDVKVWRAINNVLRNRPTKVTAVKWSALAGWTFDRRNVVFLVFGTVSCPVTVSPFFCSNLSCLFWICTAKVPYAKSEQESKQ